MLKVSNIKIDEITYDKKHFKDFDKCVEYIKLVTPDYKKYLPKTPSHRVEFELLNTNSDFANCIRRFLLDEIYVYSMSVDINDIKTDDNFILSDLFKKNLELIPFSQKEEHKNLTLSIDKTNDTDDIIGVYTRDIIITDKNNKTLDNEKYFSTNIPLIKLRSNKSLEVKNIIIEYGCAKQDAGKFCLLSNLSYEILDVKPLDENKYTKTGNSSFVSNPQHFKFGYKTHRNIEPKKIILMCCNQLLNRFNDILSELSNININTNVHFSDLIELETKGDIKFFHFKNEYWTIANIIARYCYKECKDIKFVCACIIHPSIEESIVKIRHVDSIKILNASIKKIINDINILKKAFS
jgi:DNA-directed RNA polymerase subunit L